MNILLFCNIDCIHDQKKINFLADQGHKCYLIEISYRDNDNKINCNVFDSDNIAYLQKISPFSLKKPVKTIRAFFELKDIILKNKIKSILILYLEPAALWGLIVLFFKNVKLVFFSYGTDTLLTIPRLMSRKWPFGKIQNFLYKKAFYLTDFVLATSNNQIESIRNFLDDESFDVKIVRTGVDVDKLNEIKIDDNFEELKGRDFFFLPRNMAPLYNHEFFIDTFINLPENYKRKHWIVLIDSDSSYKKYVKMIDKKLNSNNLNYIFLPKQSQENMYKLYHYCKAVVMTPLSDGSSVSAMEAMFFRKPLILGPLNYDQDIFAPPVIKIKNWDKKELAEAIFSVDSISDDSLNLLKNRIINLCDSKKELLKMSKLLCD